MNYKGVYLTESTQKNKGKRYKCPYCTEHMYRTELVSHVDNEHADLIPKDYSAARVVFNSINKKEKGQCVICKKETKWNESTWRYDRFCSEKCKESAAKLAKENMVKVYGKEHLLDDIDMQEKMLSNRGISGEYKFSTGGSLPYVGSYELKLLEFLDKVMGYRSTDIISPGPVIEYEIDGQKRKWILDQYIVPYNLAIDCKDGGDNPNQRNMPDYRAKQIAKEKAISECGKYNYIRLTNNNFAQLLEIMCEIKEQLMDSNNMEFKPIIRINESIQLEMEEVNEHCAVGGMGGVLGIADKREVYVVQMLKKNSFSGEPAEYAITSDPNFKSVYKTDDNLEIKGIDWSSIKESYTEISLFKFNKKDDKINKNGRNLVEVLCNKNFLTDDQIFYDDEFEQILTFDDKLELSKISLESTLKGEKYKIPIIEATMNSNDNIVFYRDENGVFVENVTTHLRSKSYDSVEDINWGVIQYISNGML